MNLEDLAKDPKAFDLELSTWRDRQSELSDKIDRVQVLVRELAGDRFLYRDNYHGAPRRWGMSLDAATGVVQDKAGQGDTRAASLLLDGQALMDQLHEVNAEIIKRDAVYRQPGNRWTRFYPSQTKSHPHIHRSLSCKTLHRTTVMMWAPQMSGTTEAEAVAELDEALCSVCFPSAPVALHNYESKRSRAERDARATEKAARDAVKAAKSLTREQRFKDGHGWWIETVAAAKQVLRDEIQTEAFYPGTWEREGDLYRAASATAERVLLAKGIPAAELDTIRANARKKVARDLAEIAKSNH
jgi:hypothetical protein